MTAWLLDTHVWVWCLTGSPKLPVGVPELVRDDPNRCRLSPISIWEVGMLIRKRRLAVEGGFQPWLDAALRALPLREVPLNCEVARRAAALELPHRDPADAFLVATALVHGLSLITADARLSSLPWLQVWRG